MPEISRSAIVVRDLTVSIGQEIVLKNLSFSLPEGTVAAIIGPNGSGKTTLLRALLGFVTPSSGVVEIFGHPPHEARRRVGYVPQRFLYDKTFPLTIEEFLSNRRVNGRNMDEVLEEVGLRQRKDALLGVLSGGEMQRVLMARALLRDPELLFLDEAASEVDVVGERTFYEIIKHLNETHRMTVVFVSHELDIVFGYANTVLCINRQLVCEGEPTRVLTRDTLHSVYGKDVGIFKHQGMKP